MDGPSPPALRHSDYPRSAHDFYVERPWFVDLLLQVEHFDGVVWDPCCGSGTIPGRLKASGYRTVKASDIVDRGYPGTEVVDFFKTKRRVSCIVSNPPFRLITPWIEHALRSAHSKVAVIAHLTLLESVGRDGLLGGRPGHHPTPLARVLVSRRRVSMPPGGDPHAKARGAKKAYAWFVWDHAHEGPAVVERI